MFAVIFEVQPRADRLDAYLDIARLLRPELERIEGFLENTRYRSRSRAGLLLSLSFWRDEKAVIRWRTHAGHYAAQAKGRREVLAGYRLRVGEVVATGGIGAPGALPRHRLDETEIGDAKAMVLRLGRGPAASPPLAGPPALTTDRLDGVVDPLDWAEVAAHASAETAAAAMPATPPSGERWAQVCIVRDYGLLDRREAPQFHQPVPEVSGE